MTLNTIFRIFCVTSILSVASCFALSQEALDKGFVYLRDVDPTIQVSLRYYGNENFLGRRVNGYNAPKLVMTKQAAQALKKVQQAVRKDGYSLLIYDAYRPQRAVNDFVRWGNDLNDQAKKAQYYPRVDKAQAFALVYIGSPSNHSKGNRVDLTLIKDGKKLHDVIEKKRTLLDGFEIIYLDDGSVDMGSSFDLFDVASHYENNLIADEYKTLRAYLQKAMMDAGFKPYSEEWWHFTLVNEPYPATRDNSYFDFPIE